MISEVTGTQFDEEPKDRSLDILAGLATVARSQGFNPDRLLADLSGESELAKFCRALLDLTTQHAAPKKRGRPADDNSNWQMFIAIERRAEGQTIADALREYIELTGGENNTKTRYRNGYKRYKELKKRWDGNHVPEGIAAFFSAPPVR